VKQTPFDWAGGLIADAVTAEVARTRAGGVILASPPGPATDLLRRWLGTATRVCVPDAGAVSDVAGALAASGAPAGQVERQAWRAVAEAWGAAEGLLTVGTTNKTELLLDPAPLPARILPLGDVWASVLLAHLGVASLPPVLAHATAEEVADAERALQDYLERGVDPDVAFGRMGEVGRSLHSSLDAAETRRRGLLVPKLTPWTVGCDLAR